MIGKGESGSALSLIKDRGGLNYASENVLLITRLCEKVLLIAFPGGEVENSLKKFSPAALSNEVLNILHRRATTGRKIHRQSDH